MFELLHHLNNIIWGIPLIVILLGTHLFFTVYLKGIQKYTFRGIYYSFTPEKGTQKRQGFAALSSMLAATLGTGNIIGISTAVALGGPGAVFWCLVTGILGIATSYAECYLSLTHKKKNSGGPMYVLVDMGKKKAAIFYAIAIILCSFGVGVSTQINAVSSTLLEFYRTPPWLPGIIGALLAAAVIVHGNRRIQKVCTWLVPAMSLFYMAGCAFILWCNHTYIAASLRVIWQSAWSVSSFGHGTLGGGFLLALRYGVARGLYTSEAGMGSSAIAAAHADTDSPVRQALVSMTASFWDTIVMCTITGLVIVSNLLAHPECASYSDGSLTTAAFLSLPVVGVPMLTISICAFALATIIGWYAFGAEAIRFLWPGAQSPLHIYQFSYLMMAFAGAVLTLQSVWELTDFCNALLVLPNLYALYHLRKSIALPPPKRKM